MPSLEEKLEEVHCLTERQNFKQYYHSILKDSAKSVPPLILNSPELTFPFSSKENQPKKMFTQE